MDGLDLPVAHINREGKTLTLSILLPERSGRRRLVVHGGGHSRPTVTARGSPEAMAGGPPRPQCAATQHASGRTRVLVTW
jgi:hypothetical protein